MSAGKKPPTGSSSGAKPSGQKQTTGTGGTGPRIQHKEIATVKVPATRKEGNTGKK
jgi:hypothetical protein